ncbi:MAG: ATP-binding protein [Methylocella sp.]
MRRRRFARTGVSALDAVRAGSARAKRLFNNLIDPVNQLEQRKAAGRSGRSAGQLQPYDLIVFDKLGCLPFRQQDGQLLFHLMRKLYECTSLLITTNPAFATGRKCSVTPR